MPDQWDDDGPGSIDDDVAQASARWHQADVRDAEADAREAEADRREFHIDARELVLDRWEHEISDRAAALGLWDEIEDRRREQRRLERVADGYSRRDQAEIRRGAAIERDIGRSRRTAGDTPSAPVPGGGLHLPASFGQLAAAMSGDAPLTSVLRLVLVAAVDSVGDCAAATVALATQGGRIEVAATTARWAAELDEHQAVLACGPLLEAIAGERALTADLADDERWPALARLHEARGRAVMAFGLRVANQEAGAMTVYSERSGRFSDRDAATAEFLAGHATVALARSFERVTYEAQAQAWQSALSSRDAIGQAKGMLMEQRSISADEAFDVLRETSQRLNRKVRDIAVHLVEHRRLPEE